MEFYTLALPSWICKTCGRVYINGLNNMCMVCRANRVHTRPEPERLPPRWQYRELPIQPIGRTFYETDINLDWYKEERE